ncbi:hypothetical protein GCM10009681_27750 [Luedemannella helvata]|uniref:ABM domain-containing protein n=2 Tax=Luedemannella helvata TaxID=349315 RepID=A0ABP4WNC5_9ACTN
MHAVVGIWTTDVARRDEQRRLLTEEIVPLVCRQPGFVSGFWMDDPETGKSHTTIIFASRATAISFRALVESRTRQDAQAGVTSDILTTVAVVAAAHHPGGTP